MSRYTVHTLESAPAQAKPTLAAMQQRFGFLPNIMGTMAANPILLGGFAGAFGQFHSGSLDEAEKQVLLLTNAVALECAWTIAAHTTFALEDGVNESDIRAIRAGELPNNPKYAALSQLSKLLLRHTGIVNDTDIDRFVSAGYTKAQVLEVVLGVGISTITATTTNVGETPIDARFQAHQRGAVSSA